jgi:hypothetical protein
MTVINRPITRKQISKVLVRTASDDGDFQADLQFVDLDTRLVELLDAYIWVSIKQ